MPLPQGVDLEACLQGDKLAWDAFVVRWSPLIYAAVQRATGGPRADRSELEDIAQEVFVRLVRNDYRLLRTYDAERASLSTWLTLVARSVAIDQLRKRQPVGTPGEAPEPVAPHVQQTTDGPDLPLHLLSPRQRVVLRLLFDREMSVAQAAGVIGVDEQTVRSTKHKAISRLKQHLSGVEIRTTSGDVDPSTPRRTQDDP